MTQGEIIEYRRNKNFQRNEAIFIFSIVDHRMLEELSRIFNIKPEEVQQIIKLHQEYWDATE